MTAITGGQLLVQLSSLPVTLALPSMVRSFGTDLEEAAWIVILNLLVLGSTVLLGARMGDKFGHPKIFYLGTGRLSLQFPPPTRAPRMPSPQGRHGGHPGWASESANAVIARSIALWASSRSAPSCRRSNA